MAASVRVSQSRDVNRSETYLPSSALSTRGKMWRQVVHQDLSLSLPLFITIVNLQEVADPNPDPNPNPSPVITLKLIEACWTTEPLLFTVAHV